MRFILFHFLLFLSGFSFSQTQPLILKTFVKQDTVLIRWAPTNAELMLSGLRQGYILERITGSGSFENNTSLKSFIIEPFEIRKTNYLNSGDEKSIQFVDFIDGLLNNSSANVESKQMAFAVLMLGASTDILLAEMLGCFYRDIEIENASYSYRIRIPDSENQSSTLLINSSELSQNAPMTKLSGSARPKLKQAYLSWEALSLQTNYAAYWIERSTDSVHFERRNKIPYLFLKSQDEPNKVNCDYVDTNVIEGQIYYYRITGINHFAETGKSSNIVKVYILKSIYGEVHIDSVSAIGYERKINGEFVHHREKNEVKKFVLLRSDSIASGYKFLAEQNYLSDQFNFSATVPIESGDRYYYKVAAVSPDNDTVYSFPYYFFTLDQIPPAVPQGLHGVVNDSGVVRLAWKLNPENDIRGYRVYRANSLKEEFVEVTKVFCTDSIFTDTLRLDNLTSEIYYRIAAVDLNYNNSKSCSPVKLLKPDTIAPVPAVFTDYTSYSKGVFLSWNNSSSVDVSGSILLRRSAQKTDTLFTWADTTSRFIDSTGISGEKYGYFILTSDKSKNVVTSEDLNVNYETGTRTGVSDIQSSVNRELKQIEVTWKLPTQEIYSIQIYRAKNDGGFTLYKTLRDPGAVSFIDTSISMNNTYRYKIKVVYKNGISSILSGEIKVIY